MPETLFDKEPRRVRMRLFDTADAMDQSMDHSKDRSEDPPGDRSGATPLPPQGRVLRTLALLGAGALIVTPAVRGIARRWRIHHPRAQSEPAIDKALKDSYPASDPPASRYFDIPVNRR